MKKVQYLKIMAAAILGISGMFAPQPGTLTGEKLTATVYANGEDLSVFENSGKYIKKEDDGLYCVDQDGSPDVRCAVHYFDHFAVDGKVLDGYYYHDESGRLALEGGIHYVSRMRCQGQLFDGYYYFDEQTGSLSSGGVTVQGLTVETDGKIKELVKPGTDSLEKKLEELLNGFEGQWSVYVKDLGSGEQFSINNQSMTSASVIKAFVMAASYENMDRLRVQEGTILKAEPLSDTVLNKLYALTENMVTHTARLR